MTRNCYKELKKVAADWDTAAGAGLGGAAGIGAGAVAGAIALPILAKHLANIENGWGLTGLGILGALGGGFAGAPVGTYIGYVQNNKA